MELIKITEKDGKQLVSARELHKFLEAGSNVNTWFKNQCERAMLDENEDFTRVQISETSGQTSYDYALSISSAKEIAMLNGGDKGKQARRYFIEMEKIAKDLQEINPRVPKTFREALLLAAEQQEVIEKQALQIEVMEPKIIAFENVVDSANTYTLDSVSDILNVGRTTLCRILEKKKWKTIKETNGTSSTRYAEENGYAKTIFEYIKINGKEIKTKRIVLKKKGLDILIKEH